MFLGSGLGIKGLRVEGLNPCVLGIIIIRAELESCIRKNNIYIYIYIYIIRQISNSALMRIVYM